MAKDQNFENGNEKFNIYLAADGNLYFKANDKDGDGDTRMIIADDSSQVTIVGQLQLQSSTGANTSFFGSTATEATALLGGAAGRSGRVQLFDSSGRQTVDLDGGAKHLQLFSAAGTMRADLQGDTGRLQLLNSTGVVTADLRGDAGILTLGGSGVTDGDLFILDDSGNTTIEMDGDTGHIECVSLTETSDGRLKMNIAPLMNALDSVLALRGVRYQRKQRTAPMAAYAGDAQEIGFVGQEVEDIFPELAATDANGYKSVNYSRMTVVLVEAIKEQQQLIREQAAALGEALRKISTIEASLAAHPGTQLG
jgi:endosialidase-like protein